MLIISILHRRGLDFHHVMSNLSLKGILCKIGIKNRKKKEKHSQQVVKLLITVLIHSHTLPQTDPLGPLASNMMSFPILIHFYKYFISLHNLK